MRRILIPCLMVMAAQVAVCDEYWITYEGNDFPENEGWTRVHGGIPAERWIKDGSFVIDSRADIRIFDSAQLTFNGNLDPGLGELFIMRWRLNAEYVAGFADPGVIIVSDELTGVGFIMSETTIWSLHEANISATFAAGEYHEFELRSLDMRRYDLNIDGVPALKGQFLEVFGPPRVVWGDLVQGGAGLTRWDHVRFGVVPEPALGWAVLAVFCFSRRTRNVSTGK